MVTQKQKIENEAAALEAAGFAAPIEETEEESEEKIEPTEEEKKEQEIAKDPMSFVIKALTEAYGNAPTLEQLEGLKSTHGDIFVLDLGEKDIYLYRYLKKIEYKAMLQKGFLDKPKDDQDLEVVKKCVVFPQLNDMQINSKPAGLIEALARQIELQSLFLDPALVARQTFKL